MSGTARHHLPDLGPGHALHLFQQFVQDPHMISNGMDLFLVSRNLERVADLATNIGEDVVFLVEGVSIKHHAEDGGS